MSVRVGLLGLWETNISGGFATQQHIQQFLAGHREVILRYIAMIEMRAANLLANIGWIVVVPILAIFFLLDRATLSASMVELIDASHERRFLRDVLSDMDSMLADTSAHKSCSH
jgi:predicted PurR-regulated permease PerM